MESPATSAVTHPLAALLAHGTTAGLSDAELLDRLVASPATTAAAASAAFEAIILRHGPMVLATCRHRLGHVDPADAFQATFLVLWRRPNAVRSGDRLAAFLHGTAHRVCLRARRQLQTDQSARRRLLHSGPPAASPAEQPAVAAERQESASIVREAIAQLPRPFRQVMQLCGLDGLTHEQAASVLGCPLGTVRSRVARGREQLRAQLERRGLPMVVPLPRLADPIPVALPTSYVDTALRLSANPAHIAPHLAWLAGAGGSAVLSATGISLAVAAILVAAVGNWVLRSEPTTTQARLAPRPAVVLAAIGGPPPVPPSQAVGPERKPDPARIRAEIPQVGQAVQKLLEARPDDLDPQSLVSIAIQVAALQHKLGDAAGAHATLHAAEPWIDRLPTSNQQIHDLSTLGRAQAVTGDPDAARATFDRLLARIATVSDPILRPQPNATPEQWAAWSDPMRAACGALGRMAQAYAALGDERAVDAAFDRMRRLIDQLGPDQQNHARRALLTSLVWTDRLDEAFRLAIDPQALGITFGPDGPTPEAILKAQYEALKIVGVLRPRNGEAGLAFLRRVLAWIDAHPSADTPALLPDIAYALAWLDDTPGALALAERDGFPVSRRPIVRGVSIQSQIAAGDLPAARALLRTWVAQRDNTSDRDTSIPFLQFQAGDFEAAAASAQGRLRPTSSRQYARLLLDIARAYDRLGRDADARALRDQALKAVAQETPSLIPVRDATGQTILAPDTPENRLDAATLQRAEVAELFDRRDEADRLIAEIKNPDARREAAEQTALHRALDDADIPAAIEAITRLEPIRRRVAQFFLLTDRLSHASGVWRPFTEPLDL
jgi:RNA polymerase sigma factor (sigma-70 family)